MERMLEAKFALTLCGPALPQAALAAFLSPGGYDSHLRRIRRAFPDNIDRMSRAVRWLLAGANARTRLAGGFVLWLEMPGRFDSRRLFDRAIAHGICFARGAIFSPSRSHANCLRLSCGHPWDARIERSIETLGALAAEMLEAP
jgi:DNA-binding transcriptional MocR family regulator